MNGIELNLIKLSLKPKTRKRLAKAIGFLKAHTTNDTPEDE